MNNSTATDPPTGGVDPINAIVLPIFAAFAIVIVYMPMCDFFRKRNFAMCSMIGAVTLLNLYCLINAIIWPNDNFDTWWSGEGLCDIEVNTRYMMSTVLLTSMACFTKNLADVFNPDTYSFCQTSAMKRRKLLIDILFCWGVPVVQIGLHYVVSTGRYGITPVWGCEDDYDKSWPFVVFYLLPNPIFTLLSGYFAVLMLIGLHKHRSNISSTLASSGSGMSTRYFLKLAIIACSLLIIWIPCQAYWLYRQRPVPFHSYDWNSLHDPVSWDPILFYHNSDDPFMQYNGWTSIALSLVIFCYFGFNNDAIDKYRSWLVHCGLGMIWPSLKEPRQQRSRQGSVTRNSFGSHFDLVSKAMHYFDTSRKNSHVTSMNPSEYVRSRQGSLATYEPKATPTPDSFATSALQVSDAITPSPTRIFSTPDTIPEEASFTPRKKTFFSSFRTHMHFAAPKPASPPPAKDRFLNRVALPNLDVEAQHSQSPGRVHPEIMSPLSTVETRVWSEEMPESPTMGRIVEEERRSLHDGVVVVRKEMVRRESGVSV